jgi:hypothetical protein
VGSDFAKAFLTGPIGWAMAIAIVVIATTAAALGARSGRKSSADGPSGDGSDRTREEK